jgi:hypothetical protein
LGIVHNSSTRRGIRRHRSITGRHAASRDLTSARQPPVNGEITGEKLEGSARRVVAMETDA